MKEEHKGATSTPPYISVSKLEKTLEILSNRSFSEVSPVLFLSNGFGKQDANLALNLLRFLGVIDDENKATPVMSSLRLKGDPQKEAFLKIVKEAYKPLFDQIESPQNLTPIELSNAFNANYPKLSERVIRTAIPAFLKLCEYAGLKDPGSVVGRTLKPRAEKKIVTLDKSRSHVPGGKVIHDLSGEGLHVQHIVKGKMAIMIPEEIFIKSGIDDNLNDAWRSILKASHSFAEKYLKEEKPGDTDISVP